MTRTRLLGVDILGVENQPAPAGELVGGASSPANRRVH